MRDPREHSYHLILDAIAKMQWNAAMILEAKAMEAEKREIDAQSFDGDRFTEHAEGSVKGIKEDIRLLSNY